MSRVIVNNLQRATAIDLIKGMLEHRIDQKGEYSYSSIHEILGIITEEFDELKDAVQNNNHDEVYNELLDLAVGCAFGIACIRAGSLDW